MNEDMLIDVKYGRECSEICDEKEYREDNIGCVRPKSRREENT